MKKHLEEPSTIDKEEQLIRLCQEGDVVAFERLYNQYKQLVFSLAFRFVGSKETAEEVLQETFISVYKDIQRFQFQSSFTTWLYRITYRRAADYFRKNKKTPNPVPILHQSYDKIDIEDKRPLPIDSAIENEREIKLNQAIQSLKKKHRIIIILRYFQHCSYEEISQVLGCSLGTVKSRMNRAHKALEEKLNESEYQ